MVCHCCWNQLPVPLGMPSIAGIWPDSTEIPTPLRKPISTVALRKLPMKPRRSSRARIRKHAADQGDQAASRPATPGCRGQPGDPQPAQPGGQDRRRGRVGADHQQPRRPEQREQQGREDDRVDAGDDGRLGDRGVPHHLGDRDRRQRQTSDDVAGEPGLVIVAQRHGHDVHASVLPAGAGAWPAAHSPSGPAGRHHPARVRRRRLDARVPYRERPPPPKRRGTHSLLAQPTRRR